MKTRIFIVLFFCILLSCKKEIFSFKEIDSNLSIKTDKYFLVFEQYFEDSITIKYNNKIIFNNYVKTIKRIQASDKVCIIDSIKNNSNIFLKINKRKFFFKPNQYYRYYYITKFNKKTGITMSNEKREYF